MTAEISAPAGVPVAATFNPETQRFELTETDAQGRRSGEHREYRGGDGSLYFQCNYREGVQHGPFELFHPNGQLAKRGRYTEGELDGEVSAYGSDGTTELPLRGCCVPASAWELRSRYQRGRLTRQVFYDREGQPLASDGTRWPARSAGIPEDADYEPRSGLWSIRCEPCPGRLLERFFTSSGGVAREIEYKNGQRAIERRFDGQGRPLDERSFDAEGRLHGPCARWFLDAESSPSSDNRVCEERGQFWQGQPVGTFVWLDADSEIVVRREFGAGLSRSALVASAVFDVESDALWARADELRARGRAREAICVAARAAARAAESEAPARLRAWLELTQLPVRREVAERLGSALLSADEIEPLAVLDQLLLGAAPAPALRTLAAVFPGSRRAALDFIEAALLLEPDARGALLTRALIQLERGAVDHVLADAVRLESDFAPASQHLRESVRIYFAELDFWPAREPIEPLPEGAIEVEVAQPIERVQRQIGIYATRHQHLRERLRALHGAAEPPAWLPPDLGALLPRGPLELERSTAIIEDETEDGRVEAVEVSIDETLDLDLGRDATVTSAMARVRANWAALTWLCWAVGLDTVASPEVLARREDFSAAVNMVLTRSFRAGDQLQTGGLVSRSRRIADFRWEGLPIDELEPIFCRVALAEYQEIRALFVWLMFAQNVSPFQSDIRNGS
jgi:antitoxin component YwqK of YwqJK toxin-antitoxin module